MLKYIEEHRKYVKISGFRGINIQNSEEFVKSFEVEIQSSVFVQFFNADLIATWEHIYFAVLNALSAFSNRRIISKKLAIETLIYASAQRQIRKAIALLGVKHSSPNVAVTIVGDTKGAVRKTFLAIKNHVKALDDETVLELTQEKTRNLCKAFGITTKELEAVSVENSNTHPIVSLIIERMALMQTHL